MGERILFEAGDAVNGIDYLGIQIVGEIGGERLAISCNDEWCGSTETGFGATVSLDISKQDARRLRNYLNQYLGDE